MRGLREAAARCDQQVQQARLALEDAVLDAVRDGLSQREIGREIRRSQPEVARLAARARARSERHWPTAAESARAIEVEVRAGDEDFALRLVKEMLDTFRSLSAKEREIYLAEQPRVSDRRWDALVRTSIGWACREVGHPAPRWARVRALEQLWFVRPERSLAGRLIQSTPAELAIVGIYLDADSLRGL